jgi:photosystem II stability/assembly factor-like uncharacterized protein
VIIKTSDSGVNWTIANSPGQVLDNGFKFVDSQHGWALIQQKRGRDLSRVAIMATSDGGTTWLEQWEQELNIKNWYSQLQFLNNEVGFCLIAADTQAWLVATTDGGKSWELRCIGVGVTNISFTDSLNGWGLAKDSLWHTTDGGATWNKQWAVPDQMKDEFPGEGGFITGVTTTTCWAQLVGEAGMGKTAKLVLYTVDGGNKWTINSAYPQSLIPGNGSGRRTVPGFRTLRFLPISTTTVFLAANPPTDYPVLYCSDDAGKSWSTVLDGMNEVPNLPKGRWADLCFLDDRQGFAAVITPSMAADGKMLKNSLVMIKTNDGGQSWTTILESK